MWDKSGNQQEENLSGHALNEVIVTTREVSKKANELQPHYISIRGGVDPVDHFGEKDIDEVLDAFKLKHRIHSRIFVPRGDFEEIKEEMKDCCCPWKTPDAITARYAEDEKDDEVRLGFARSYRITFEEALPPDLMNDLIGRLGDVSIVESARQNYVYEAWNTPPNDYWYKDEQQEHFGWINWESVWQDARGHEDIVIAIIDSGVFRHNDLKCKLETGCDFVGMVKDKHWRLALDGCKAIDNTTPDDDPVDNHGHGTRVAGIAGAPSNNGTGIAGVCHAGSILPVRTLFRVECKNKDIKLRGTDCDISAGIYYAVNCGAHVLNMSFGDKKAKHDRAPKNSLVSRALNYAHRNNVCAIAAIGNIESELPTETTVWPAAHQHVLAVGALNEYNDDRWAGSHFGSQYRGFVMAPGYDVYTTNNSNTGTIYSEYTGTSMAAPFVSGLAALIISVALERKKSWSVDQVYRLIRDNATPISNCSAMHCGRGRINVVASLAKAKEEEFI